MWDHADLDEVRRECRAQIERAILWGFDVSHLDAHMGTMQIKSEFFDVYLDLAVEFKLPLRLSGADTEGLIGFPFRALAAEEGVVFPDDFVYVPGVGSRQILLDAIPGSSRASPRPTCTPPWTAPSSKPWPPTGRPGVDDHRLLVHDPDLRVAARRRRRHGDRLPAAARPHALRS